MTEAQPANPDLPAPAAAPAATSNEPAAKPEVIETKTAVTEPDKPEPVKDDWRKTIAGDDEKFYKQLGRFASMDALGKSYKELSNKISSGELRAPLKEDATDEERANWRKANGIPEKPEDYDIKLSEGLVIGEEDKKEIGDFLKGAHGINASPEFVNMAVESFLKMREGKLAEISDRDETQQLQTIDEMKQEWGGDYKVNMNLIATMLEGAPEGLGDSILKARMPNGVLVGNDPNAARFLAGLARELNPAATIVPAGAEANMETVETEMNQLKAKMGTKAYTDADRKRYLQLAGVMEKANKKKSAA